MDSCFWVQLLQRDGTNRPRNAFQTGHVSFRFKISPFNKAVVRELCNAHTFCCRRAGGTMATIAARLKSVPREEEAERRPALGRARRQAEEQEEAERQAGATLKRLVASYFLVFEALGYSNFAQRLRLKSTRAQQM